MRHKIAGLIISLCLSASCARLYAAAVPPEIALIAAGTFMDRQVAKMGDGPLDRHPAALRTAGLYHPDDGSALYLVEFAPTGFVILSGDDRVPPVLGFSVRDRLSGPDGNPAFREWIHRYARAVRRLTVEPADDGRATAAWRELASGGSPRAAGVNREAAADPAWVSPLLTSAWNQGTPYNLYTPLEDGRHTLTGCVATAMAQLIRYWRYPSLPYGIEADPAPYLYPSMPEVLNTQSTASQIHQVARLMLHCGISVDMDWGLDISSAFTGDAVDALRFHFGYASTLGFREKSDYSDDEWHQWLQANLAASRPVIYRVPAHAWICDGFYTEWQSGDPHYFYHMNWGWGGDANGYYALCCLGRYQGEDQYAILDIMPNLVTDAYVQGQVRTGADLVEFSRGQVVELAAVARALTPPMSLNTEGQVVYGEDFTEVSLWLDGTRVLQAGGDRGSWEWHTAEAESGTHVFQATAATERGAVVTSPAVRIDLAPPFHPFLPRVSDFRADPVSETSVRLSWTYRDDRAEKFQIGWTREGQSGYQAVKELVHMPGLAERAWTVSTAELPLECGQVQHFRIRAVAGDILSEYVYASVEIPSCKPFDVSAEALSPSSIWVAWSYDGPESAEFNVERSEDGDTWSRIAILGGTDRALADEGLSCGTKYSYRLSVNEPRAVPSLPASTLTPLEPLRDLSASLQRGSPYVLLSFTYPQSACPADGFLVWRSTDPLRGYTEILTLPPSHSTRYSVTDKTAPCGRRVYYKVVAFKNTPREGRLQSAGLPLSVVTPACR